jgi:hypothetical protein
MKQILSLFLIGSLLLCTHELSAQRSRMYDAPIIVQPFRGSTVKPLQPQFLVFIWTPTGPPGFGTTRYTFEMIDMTENRLANPEDAFRSPAVQAYHVETNLISPNLMYNMSKPPLQLGHVYAVRVTAIDEEFGQVFINGGVSPVITFTYGVEKVEAPPQSAAEEEGTEESTR